MPNGSGAVLFSDVPAWARLSAVSAITAIALWLVWTIGNDVRVTTASTNQLIRQHISEQSAAQATLSELIREQSLTRRVMQQLCVQQATDPADRRACLDIR